MTIIAAPGRRAVSWRALLPREHGSWSLAFEPLALGLIVAPSWSGAALAAGAAALFFARRPWQAARAGDVRVRMAAAALIVLGAGAVMLLGVSVASARGPAGFALLAALPAGATFAWCDRRKAGREVIAELAGAAFFAVFPAAIAVAAGRTWPVAAALASFAFTRSLTSILPIRAFLRQRKGAHPLRWPPVAVACAAGLIFTTLAATTARWIPAAWTIVFAGRTIWLLGSHAPTWSARRLGLAEACLGFTVTVTTGLSFR